MRIGITIDGSIRNFIDRLEVFYKREFGSEGITKPINPFDLEASFKFPDKDFFLKWLYEDYVLEIFGFAQEQYLNSTVELNEFLVFLDKHNIELVLLSKEICRSIQATNHFLSLTPCQVRNVKYVRDNDDYTKDIDVIITANPFILKQNQRKKCYKYIRLARDFNADSKSDYTINEVRDLLDDKVKKYILKIKTELLIKKLKNKFIRFIDSIFGPDEHDLDVALDEIMCGSKEIGV